jgi:hypothetical protein
LYTEKVRKAGAALRLVDLETLTEAVMHGYKVANEYVYFYKTVL